MAHKIDQSGRVEDTRHLTVVAYANGEAKSLLISAVEKRKLLVAMRAMNQPKRIFVLKIFAGLIFFLVENEKLESVEIDEEYTNHEADIKFILLFLYERAGKQPPEINFGRIGKKSNAHKVALSVFQRKSEPDVVVNAEDIFNLFLKRRDIKK